MPTPAAAFSGDASETAAEQLKQFGEHNDGLNAINQTIAKARKSQAAHGVSICEVCKTAGVWSVVANSVYGRRLTANTPMRVSSPVASHAQLKSKKFDILATGSTRSA